VDLHFRFAALGLFSSLFAVGHQITTNIQMVHDGPSPALASDRLPVPGGLRHQSAAATLQRAQGHHPSGRLKDIEAGKRKAVDQGTRLMLEIDAT